MIYTIFLRTAFSCSVIALLLLLATYSPRLQKSQYQPQIEAIMHAQSQAWNRGDLEAFMAPYWHSEDLVFIGKNGPTYGWEKTLQNYRKGYPSKDAMGELTFTVLRTDVISREALFVIGKWHLKRTIGDISGHFSLVFRKIAGKWQIVADHSS